MRVSAFRTPLGMTAWITNLVVVLWPVILFIVALAVQTPSLLALVPVMAFFAVMPFGYLNMLFWLIGALRANSNPSVPPGEGLFKTMRVFGVIELIATGIVFLVLLVGNIASGIFTYPLVLIAIGVTIALYIFQVSINAKAAEDVLGDRWLAFRRTKVQAFVDVWRREDRPIYLVNGVNRQGDQVTLSVNRFLEPSAPETISGVWRSDLHVTAGDYICLSKNKSIDAVLTAEVGDTFAHHALKAAIT